jgi:septum formation protein
VTRLILASGSATRARLLAAAGLSFDVVAPRVDEDEIKRSLRAEGAPPRDVADALAELKARRVSSRHPAALVIGADQVLALEGADFNKPRDRAEARSHLLRLRGRKHMLHSAAVVCRDEAPLWRHVDTARLWMRAFSDPCLEDYLRLADDADLGNVGAYALEGRGAQLFDRVEGDFFTVLGLPLLPLLAFLRLHGACPA